MSRFGHEMKNMRMQGICLFTASQCFEQPQYEPSGPHQTGAYPGFCRMKRPGIFIVPPEWDASASQG